MASLPILWCLRYPHTRSSAVIWLRTMRDPGNSSSARWPSWRPFLVYTCQYVTPRDEDSIDYYYCWGPRHEQNLPGLSEMLRDTAEAAFIEDKLVLEAQHARIKEKPHYPQISAAFDAGPGRMLWVLDNLLKAEAGESAAHLS